MTNSSPRPKSVAAMFLLGAFLTGGAVGYAASRTLGPSAAPVSATALMREVIKQKLKLAPDQSAKLDSAYAQRRVAFDSIRAISQPAIDSIRAIHQPAIDSVRVANHAKVMQFLDSNQKATYRQMIEDDKKRADSLRKAGGQK
jgi:hypothetical protein